jgi:hypothetical protein
MAEKIFGVIITNSDSRDVPVRFIGEQHVTEDCGFIPTVADWLSYITAAPWMKRVGKKLSHTLEIEGDGIRTGSSTITEETVGTNETAGIGNN